MASYNSKDGVWIPKEEKVALVDQETGEPYIYQGPDRAAFTYLKEQGVDHLGVPFHKDTEIIFRAKQLNMTLEEFCELHKNTEELRKSKFDAEQGKLTLHRPEVRKPGSKFESGGKDFVNPQNSTSGALTGLPSNVPSGLAKQALNKPQ